METIFNFDETGVCYDAPAKYTVNEKGARSVAVGTSGHERLRSTVLLTVSAKGKKCAPFIIHHHALPSLNKKKSNTKSTGNALARHRRVTKSWSRIIVDGEPKVVELYRAENTSAWMHTVLMKNDLRHCFAPDAGKDPVLYCDNMSAHTITTSDRTSQRT